jgi:subtilisin family serine protease
MRRLTGAQPRPSRGRLALLGLLTFLALGGCGDGGRGGGEGGGNQAPGYVESLVLLLPPEAGATRAALGSTPEARVLERALRAKEGPGRAAGLPPAPGASNLQSEAYLLVAWDGVPGARGYRIYARLAGQGSWTPLGQVSGEKTWTEGILKLQYAEGVSLQVGVAVQGPRGEGPITPAPPLELIGLPTPLSPRDGEDFPSNPLFRWRNSPRAEAVGVLILSKEDPDRGVGRVFEGQVQEWRPQERLAEGVYEWYALNFRGRTLFQHPELKDILPYRVWSARHGGDFSIGGALRANISGHIRIAASQGTLPAGISLPEGLGEALERLLLKQELEALLQDPPPMVPGEVIVRLREGAWGRERPGRLQVRGFGLERERELALPGVHLYRLAQVPPGLRRDDPALPLRAALALLEDPQVVWAQPNYLAFARRIPNDPLYQFNWHYDLIGLPRAWDITVGSPSVVVGVADSGVLWDPLRPERTHPDLVGQVLGGYDFIRDPRIGADGDGRDPNPYDTGPLTITSYHGSHVGGTIGAAGDNGIGIPGVAWRVKQVHARVLGPNFQTGTDTGDTVDITESILWLAGLPVPGAPANPHPAQVINLSLGSSVPCVAEPLYRESIAQAVARNVIVVGAAGNENIDVANDTPSSCPGVISVGAVERDGTRAPYSNYGTILTLMAPGGRTARNPQDGVLSLSKNDTTGEMNYRFLQGTSMAAPHVAGLVALMKSLKPTLTPQEAKAVLQATAIPMSAAACERPTGAECGAGLVNAPAALRALGAAPPPPVAGGLEGTLVLACPVVGDRGNCSDPRTRIVRLTTNAPESGYVVPDVRRGMPYAVAAWKDVNGNGNVDAGDLVGLYPREVVPPATGVDFTVSPR